MSYLPQLALVAGVMFLACVSPGPDLLAVSSHAMSARRSGLGVAYGVASSHMIWAALAVFGLGVIVSDLAWLYQTIRLVGAAYLIFLGAKMLIGLPKPNQEKRPEHAQAQPFTSSYRKGFLVGMTNPKAAAFFGSLFVTILPLHAPVWVHAATLATVSLVSVCWFSTVALLFSTDRVQRGYARMRRPIDAFLGTVLVALGATLAFDR
jgi:RhtB (resistance to homoserine/threonine) family protein